ASLRDGSTKSFSISTSILALVCRSLRTRSVTGRRALCDSGASTANQAFVHPLVSPLQPIQVAMGLAPHPLQLTNEDAWRHTDLRGQSHECERLGPHTGECAKEG